MTQLPTRRANVVLNREQRFRLLQHKFRARYQPPWLAFDRVEFARRFGADDGSSTVPRPHLRRTTPARLSRHVIDRPRLLGRLDDSVHHPITVVSGPAGSGK